MHQVPLRECLQVFLARREELIRGSGSKDHDVVWFIIISVPPLRLHVHREHHSLVILLSSLGAERTRRIRSKYIIKLINLIKDILDIV